MPPTSSKPPPLPLAPDRAALSNKISLLLSGRTSLLKTLNPASSSAQSSTQSSTQTRRYKVNADDIEQLFSGPRPNEGVGYVPDRKTAAGDAAAREDRMLRGRLLGKAQRGGKGSTAAGKKFAAAESESDEEPGRSGLGKRKRPKREHVAVDEAEEKEEGGGENEEESGEKEEEELGKDEVEDTEMGQGKEDIDGDAVPVQQETMADTNGGDDAKKNKKKRKRQREKEKQKQKKLGNAS